jgi:hypothetical protein
LRSRSSSTTKSRMGRLLTLIPTENQFLAGGS